MPYNNKEAYLKDKKFKGKIFSDKQKLIKLIELAKTGKYSAPKLAKIFECDKKPILYSLYCHNIILSNLGQFKKKYKHDKFFFDKLGPISAYWAGFIAADGTLTFKDNGICIGLNKKDKDHLLKFKEATQTNSPIKEVKSNNSSHISIYSKEIFSSLIKLGIKPNKSLSISHVNIPDKLMSHFIRGVFDGDGSISGNDRSHLQLCIVGNKPFLEQIQDFLIRKVNVSKTKIYPLTQSQAYKLQYTGSQIFKILKLIYNKSNEDICLNRKYIKYLEFNKFKPCSGCPASRNRKLQEKTIG
jgi:hypothetical protein